MHPKKPAEPAPESFFRTREIFPGILRRARPGRLKISDPRAPLAENLRMHGETARRAAL